MKKILGLYCMLWLLTSCGEYYRVQKSTDVSERYSYAKKSYNEKKYGRVILLMEDIVTSLSGTSEGPQSTYLMADSYYHLRRVTDAARYFQIYYTSYPKAPMVEEARYKAGYCLYEASPEPRLDQTDTYSAIKELQAYLDYFPEGRYRDEVEGMLFRLQDKLAYKELLAAKLYYELGLYLGNNYQSAVVTAKNALKDYPYTRHREDLLFLILRAKAEEAEQSVEEKRQERLREAVDHYYNYINEYSEGRYQRMATRLYERLKKHIRN